MKKLVLFILFLAVVSRVQAQDVYSYEVDILQGAVNKIQIAYRTDGWKYITNDYSYNAWGWQSNEYKSYFPWIEYEVSFKSGGGKIKVIIYKNGSQWRYQYLSGGYISGRLDG